MVARQNQVDMQLVFVLQLVSVSLRKRKAVWQFRKVHARHGPKRRRCFFCGAAASRHNLIVFSLLILCIHNSTIMTPVDISFEL